MAWADARATRHIWWIFLLVLIGDTVLVGVNVARTARNEAEVARTLETLNALNSLRATLIDAETGTRGFVITGDEAFLQPYGDARQNIPGLFRQLRELLTDEPELLEKLPPLEALSNRRTGVLETQIAERRKANRDLDRDAALAQDGQRLMNEIRSRLRELTDAQNQQFDARGQLAQAAFRTSIVTTMIGGALTIGMLILANYLMRRQTEIHRRSEARLRQSEERFRAIAEALPQFVWMASVDGHHEYCNRRWYDYTGLSSEQSLGYGWSGPLHPDERERAEALWKHSIATGDPFEMEYRIRRRDGAYRWFLVRATSLRDEAGRIIRWLGTGTDIEDQKRAEEELERRVRQRTAELQGVIADLHTEAMERERATEQLNQTAIELARSNRELEQFAYLASHDLQEPLRKIQAFADRLKQKFREQLPEDARDYLERMQSAAGRMRRLIDDLLILSRVTTHSEPFAEVDLNVIVAEVLGDLEEAVRRSGARVDVGSLPTLRADPAQMRQMVQNLLTNALKFHQPGAPPLVTIRAATLDRMPDDPPSGPARMAVRVDVEDRGIGFDAVYRERIFEVFQRLHGRGVYEGTGIGLAIVRKIVERHGGTITVRSTPGAGATFSVFLPMAADGEKRTLTPTAAPRAAE